MSKPAFTSAHFDLTAWFCNPLRADAGTRIPGISRKFPYAQDSRIDPRCASTGLSRPYPGRSVALLLLMCSASEFWGWLRPTTFGQRTARHARRGSWRTPAAMVARAFCF